MRFKAITSLSAFALLPFSLSAVADAVIEQITVVGESSPTSAIISTSTEAPTTPDLSDTLQRLPGVFINSNGPVTSVLQYRGMFGDRVNVSIDGANVAGAGPNAMDSPISYIQSSAAPTLSIYRGIAPVSAGFETIGGAVTVESKGPQFSATNDVDVSGGFMFGGMHNGDRQYLQGSASVATDSLFFGISAQDQEGDNAEDGEGRLVPNSGFARNSFQIDAGATFGNHTVSAQLTRIDTGKSGTAALAMDIDYIDSDLYRVNYTYAQDDQEFLLTLYGNDSAHGMDNFRQRPNMMSGMYRETTALGEQNGVKASFTDSFSMGSWEVGAEFVKAEHDVRIENPNNAMFLIHNFNNVERDISSVYNEWALTLDQNMGVDLGWRYTQIDSSAGEVTNSMAMMNPNVASLVQAMNGAERSVSHDLYDVVASFHYQSDESLTWLASIAQKERAPSYQALFSWFPLGVSAGLADGKNYVGDLSLEKETAYQIDLGVNYVADGLMVSPRFFYQDIENYIQGTLATDPAVIMVANMMGASEPLKWTNTDATLYGFDVLATYQYNENLSVESTLSYVRGERDDIQDDLYRVAPMTAFIRAIWTQDEWTMQIESQLVAKQSNVSALQNEQETAGYGVFNARAAYYLSDTFSITLDINNLFDKQYTEHLASVNRVMGQELPQGERLPSLGRNVGLQMQVMF